MDVYGSRLGNGATEQQGTGQQGNKAELQKDSVEQIRCQPCDLYEF